MWVPVMVAMTVMHEQMHQWAGQQEQVRQYPQHMGAVLGKKQGPGYGEKTVEHPASSG
jgi:hypothetical protein